MRTIGSCGLRLGASATVLLWASVPVCPAQNPLSPEELLSRIQLRMERNLEQLPNFTCSQTIERSRRERASGRLRPGDTVRLEVAFIGDRELYAWPGSPNFQETELHELVAGGTIGTGDFALHARSLFLSHAPAVAFAGEEPRHERRAVRYDFRFPLSYSDYRIRAGGKAAKVPYHGSFWADPDSLDLICLQVRAEAGDIPRELGVSAILTELDYAAVPLGESVFLLPQSALSEMTFASGEVSVNRTEFGGCRQFSAEASLSFDEPPEPPEHPGPPEPGPSAFILPPGITIPARLDLPIDSQKAGLGDLITATVTADVKSKGGILVPRGALLTGRIRLLARQDRPHVHFAVGLEFFSVRFQNTLARFAARLDDIGPLPGLTRDPSLLRGHPHLPGVGLFHVHGARFRLPQGLRMIWKTIPPPP